jgi:hypothetical protein
VDALIQINPLVAADMAARQYRAGSCARGLERFPEKWTSGFPKKMRPRKGIWSASRRRSSHHERNALQCVIPKSGHRFSEKITHKQKAGAG